MDYPENIKTRKQKITYWIFKHYYVLNMGKGQVIGRFTSFVPEGVSIVLFFELYLKIHIPKGAIIPLIISFLFICYAVGYFYMKLSADKIDTQVSTERNPILMEMHKNMVKKRDEL